MKSLQEILETEGSTNATGDAVAGFAPPIFSTRRFGGWDEFVVPEDHYLTIRKGRDKYARWETHLPNVDIKSAVQKALYRDGCCLITNQTTNASVMLKHAKTARARAAQLDDALTMAFESTEDEGDFTVFDEAQIAPLYIKEGTEYDFDEEEETEYWDAFDFYLAKTGNEDSADAFAQIVACFFDNVYSSEDESDTIDSMFNAAVTEVKAGSAVLGFDDITPELIWASKDYIEASYDIITTSATELEDGTEYEIPYDEELRQDLTEGATLAELPSVGPEDGSKSETEGWAIVNMKDDKVIEKPKTGETFEHKSAWLKEYYGNAGVQSGMECVWVNTKTGVVTKMKDPKASK